MKVPAFIRVGAIKNNAWRSAQTLFSELEGKRREMVEKKIRDYSYDEKLDSATMSRYIHYETEFRHNNSKVVMYSFIETNARNEELVWKADF